MRKTQLAYILIVIANINPVICMSITPMNDELIIKNEYGDLAIAFIFVELIKSENAGNVYNSYLTIHNSHESAVTVAAPKPAWLRLKRNVVVGEDAKRSVSTPASTGKPNIKRRRNKLIVPVICG